MSIDKWLTKNKTNEEKSRNDELFKNLSKDKTQELKMKSVRKISGHDNKPIPENDLKSDDFLSEIITFKSWLDKRTYLRGDRDKIETWITNLFNKIQSDITKKHINNNKSQKAEILTLYEKIPHEFLDTKTRIAVNKKIDGSIKSSSDTYYLKKLKVIIQEKLKEAEYYRILKKILNF